MALEIEVVAAERAGLSGLEVERICCAALRAVGLTDGHLAIEFVDAERIQHLNNEYRDKNQSTDVLSFPVDESDTSLGPRELGDILICPQLSSDLREAIVHGALHLAGMDHEQDSGEMLELQAEVMSRL